MGESNLVLVVDDEPELVHLVRASLRRFDVLTASDGAEAISVARAHQPDCVLLDVMMPGLDGYSVCRTLRSDSSTSGMAIIMLTARSLSVDKIEGLSAGADDFVVKPFDPQELEARVAATLRRRQDMHDISPLTGLPGNRALSRAIESRIAATPQNFALIHADLDDFKLYNDAHGFVAGDRMIALTAEVLREVTERRPRVFVGHVGGDDFALLCPADAAAGLCRIILARFVEQAGDLDLSLGVATTANRRFESEVHAAAAATAMKNLAKQIEGSAYVIDRP